MNIVALAQQYSSKEDFTAYIFKDQAFLNSEISAQAKKTAGALRDLGQQSGDLVATILPNCIEIPSIYEGVLRRGGVLLPVIFSLSASEIAYIIEDSEAKWVITTGELLDKVRQALESRDKEITLIVINGDKSNDYISYEEMMEKCDELDEITPRETEDTAVIMYTSGTTGKPKGVMLTHGNYAGCFTSDFYEPYFGGNARALVALPMNHQFGLGVIFTLCWKYRGTAILQERFDPLNALRDIEKYRVTFLPMVPTMYLMILATPELSNYDTSSVRTCLTGSAPFPVEKIQEVEKRLGGVLVNNYGLTESLEGASQTLDGIRKPGSVGKKAPGIDLKIMDKKGREVSAGQWGEICIKGWSVMKGYLNKPEATAQALINGWLYTGDVGFLDDDGHLFITDRIKDMMIRGGENIYTIEVENAIFKHPGIAEACVIGLPDKKYGEEVYAFVRLRPDCDATENEIMAEVQKHIAKFKCPKKIWLWNELPKTRLGKIDKRSIRERAMKEISNKSNPSIKKGKHNGQQE